MKFCNLCKQEYNMRHSCKDEEILMSVTYNFAGVLKLARITNKLSVKKASEKLGISVQYIFNIENQYSVCSYEMLDRIANFYNLDKKELAKLRMKETTVYKEYKNYLKKIGA